MADDKNKHMDYEAEIARFYDEFPEHRGLTYIINPDKYDTFSAFLEDTPDFAAKLADYQNYDRLRANNVSEETIQDLKDHKYLTLDIESGEKYFQEGGYCQDIYHLDTFLENVADHKPCPFFSLILPRSQEDHRQIRYLDMFDKQPFQESQYLEISQKHIFHHEIGHALYNQTRSDEIMAFYDSGRKDLTFRFKTEAAAESYSMIRLCQEYGHDHEGVQFIYAERTLARLLDPDSPYSFLPAMHEVARLSQEGQLDDLSPQDCVELAARITEEKVLTPERAKNIENSSGKAYWNITIAGDIKQIGLHLGHLLCQSDDRDVLREAQYILQCLDDLTSNNPKVQTQIKRMWKNLQQNPEIQTHGPESHFFRSDKLNAKQRPTLLGSVRKKLFPKM